MNDLELMYLLDENGYEPSIENLKILKEYKETNTKENPLKANRVHTTKELQGKSQSDKFIARFGPDHKGWDKKEKAVSGNSSTPGEKSGTSTTQRSQISVNTGSNIEREATPGTRKYQKSGKYNTEPDSQEREQKKLNHLRSTLRAVPKRNENGESTGEAAYTEKEIETITDNHLKELNTKRKAAGLPELELKRNKRGKGKVRDSKIFKEESFSIYSDYELYQILEENGYTTTEKNLSILKEGIECGKYEILDEAKDIIKRMYNGTTTEEDKKRIKENPEKYNKELKSYHMGKSIGETKAHIRKYNDEYSAEEKDMMNRGIDHNIKQLQLKYSRK